MPSQFPAFRLMVAHQMEGFRERIAQRIREEAAKHGESAIDLAHELQVYPTTAERWFRGDRTPQRRHRKQLAAHWELPLEVFEPDLAAEERKVHEQLTRIEDGIKEILEWVEAQKVGELERDEVAAVERSKASDPPSEAEGSESPSSAEAS